ncbi:hypothetical protein HPB51_009406 [Rhipicephalus microplus]|uniref:Peptidase M13 N-terminal domain-containing protein n=1 Tax=Rhipicephalus microplus TaxID=6941 RepID=A0A9J6ESD2_RHIMP|nr:hypothetical protein HPB51_009406 [Rhipicephalus microplus]
MLVDVSQQPTLLASLNRSANPCHNFYRFVCDGWLARQGDRFSLLEELALTAQRDAATILRHIQVPAVGAISAVHKAALLMQSASSRRDGLRPEALLQFMASVGLTWDLNVVFELELLPMPKRAGGRPRWVLSASTQLNSWRQERRRLGPEYLTRIRQYVKGFSDARVTRSLVDSIFEADDEVLRVTNVYNGGRESRTIDKLCEVAPEFQASSQRVRDGSVRYGALHRDGEGRLRNTETMQQTTRYAR